MNKMRKIAIEMLLIEKKKALSLCVNLAVTIFMSTVLLQLLGNPLFDIRYYGYRDLSADLSLVYFLLIMLCSGLVAYSSIYYIKIHSREIGLVKLSGFDTFEMVRYLGYQNLLIIFIAFIIALVMIIIFIPLIQFCLYSYLCINGNVLMISSSIIFECLMIVVCEFIVIVLLELHFINQTSIPEMMEMHNIVSYKKNRKKLKVLDILYVVVYILGIVLIFSGKTLDFGVSMVVSILACVSAYQILNKFIPNVIEIIIDRKKLKALSYVVLGESSLFIQQSMINLLFSLIILIAVPMMIFASIDEPIYYSQLIVVYFIINIVMYLSLKDKFKLDLQEKKILYHNISKIGLTIEEIEVIDRKKEFLVLIIFMGITGIYFVSLIISAFLKNKLSLLFLILLVLANLIPAILCVVLIERNRKGEFEKWRKSLRQEI